MVLSGAYCHRAEWEGSVLDYRPNLNFLQPPERPVLTSSGDPVITKRQKLDDSLGLTHRLTLPVPVVG